MSLSTFDRAKLDRIRRSFILDGDDGATTLPHLGNEVTSCTSVIDDASCHLEVDDLVEADLTGGRLINWCRTIHPLHPLKLEGRRDQFLGAISLALWGFTNGATFLRRLMFVFVAEFGRTQLFERWIQNSDTSDQTVAEEDFETFVKITREQQNTVLDPGEPDRFPMPLHVFATANVLRRPVVVVGEKDDPFVGLYLPILWKPSSCTKSPLVLALAEGKYYPLVGQKVSQATEKLAEQAIPLVTSDLEPMKMQFLLEAEEKDAHNLLQNYLDIVDLNLTRSSDVCLILSARLNYVPLECGDSRNPGTSDLSSSSAAEEEAVPNQKFLVNDAIASAPSASVLTLNNLEETHQYQEGPAEMSMLRETCRYAGCTYQVSRYTEPFCWEHVGGRSSSPAGLQEQRQTEVAEPFEVSLVNERCREPRCPNFASRYVYPYCYEHLDRSTVEYTIKKRPPPSSQMNSTANSVVMERCNHGACKNYASQYIFPFCYEHIDDREALGAVFQSGANHEANNGHVHDNSMLAEHCAHPNCHNFSSKYTFPVCYEHLDSPHAVRRAKASTRTVTLHRPISGDVPAAPRAESRQNKQSSSLATPTLEINQKFDETMKELEARTKKSVALCLSAGCSNFGNSRCRGFCHSCHKLMHSA